MAFEKVFHRLLHVGFLAARPMTLGVRVAAFDSDNRIFLVRHTYLSGWYLPGGGVDPGETIEDAALREIEEEGNLEAREGLRLVSAHYNNRVSKRDHVLFYRANRVAQTREKRPDREIAEAAFFSLDDLPRNATEATRRRLDEICHGLAPDPYW